MDNNTPKLYWYEVPESPVTFVIIHNTWNSYRSFKHHVKFINGLGYSCVCFDLKMAQLEDRKHLHRWILSPRPIYKIWWENVTQVLESVPGEKVIYGFSCPAMAGLLAASDRDDIRAVICDGGPFADVWQCTDRLFDQFQDIPTTLLRHIVTTLGVWRLGLTALKDLSNTLTKWPSTRPILSIRGGKDPLVYPENIHKIFSAHKQLDIAICLIQEGEHLDGLKKFPFEYKKAVRSFLKKINL